MSDPTRSHAAGRALILGAASGMRTFTPPAVLAIRGRWGRGRIRRILPLTAAGELLADKSPFIPARSDAPSLLARIASGTAVGAALGGARGAGAGAAGAAATTYATEQLRSLAVTHTGLPDPVVALAEDALAIGIAAAASAGLRGSEDPEDGGTAVAAADAGGPAPAAQDGGGGVTTAPGAQAPRQGEPEPPPRPSPLAAVARGLGAAAVGTLAMTSVQTAYLKLTGSSASDTPERMGRRVMEGVLRRRVRRGQGETLNMATHLLYGTMWGAPLGLVAGSLPRRLPASVLGLGTGLVVWGAGLAGLPAARLAPPPQDQPPEALAIDLAMHLAYGGATGAAYRALGG